MPKIENLFQCECKTHLIQVEYDKESGHTLISFYYYANLRNTLWYRIKQAFNILLDRKYNMDDFILSEAEALRLSKKILSDIIGTPNLKTS